MTTEPRQRPGDQQPPVPNDRPSIHDLVIRDLVVGLFDDPNPGIHLMEDRKRLGLERYGSLLQAFNSRDAYRDALEEMSDLIVYTRQLIEEHREGGTAPGPMLIRLEIIYRSLLILLVDMSTLSLPASHPRYGDGEQAGELADGAGS
jgi:hypothetical protein